MLVRRFKIKISLITWDLKTIKPKIDIDVNVYGQVRLQLAKVQEFNKRSS